MLKGLPKEEVPKSSKRGEEGPIYRQNPGEAHFWAWAYVSGARNIQAPKTRPRPGPRVASEMPCVRFVSRTRDSGAEPLRRGCVALCGSAEQVAPANRRVPHGPPRTGAHLPSNVAYLPAHVAHSAVHSAAHSARPIAGRHESAAALGACARCTRQTRSSHLSHARPMGSRHVAHPTALNRAVPCFCPTYLHAPAWTACAAPTNPVLPRVLYPVRGSPRAPKAP